MCSWAIMFMGRSGDQGTAVGVGSLLPVFEFMLSALVVNTFTYSAITQAQICGFIFYDRILLCHSDWPGTPECGD